MKPTLSTAASLALAIALIASGAAQALPQSHFKGDRYARLARISLDQARATALRIRPGVITDQELERERGGSGLRYSFDVKSAGKTFEIGIDARTGRPLENSPEGPNAD